MEDRTQAPTGPPQHRQLLERLRSRIAPGERPLIESFVRLLLGRAATEYIERTSEEALIATCLSAYRFFASAGQEPRVRVVNPEFSRDGWDAPITLVETVVSDRPFIVDTVRDALLRTGSPIRVFLHPVVGCERDPHGAVLSIAPPEAALRRDSFIHVELEP